jgi:hypothetical protein
MGEHKSAFFTEGTVQSEIKLIGILIDKLLFHLIEGKHLQTTLLLKMSEWFWLYPYEVTLNCGWLYLKSWNVPIIIHCLYE